MKLRNSSFISASRLVAPTRRSSPLSVGFVLAACVGVVSPAALAQYSTNLIVNAGAEAAGDGAGAFNGAFVAGSLPGWTVTGELTAISYNLPPSEGYPLPTDPGPNNRGANFFGGGYGSPSVGVQSIDLGFARSAIDGDGAHYSLSGWLGGYATQDDSATLSVTFRNAGGQSLGTRTLGPVNSTDRGGVTALIERRLNDYVPLGAVSADVRLQMDRAGGSSNDGYADNLSLVLAPSNVAVTAPGVALLGSSFNTQIALRAPFAGSYSGDQLLAFGFNLAYDHSLLRLASVQVASGWDDDSSFFTDVAVAGSAFPGIANSGQAALSLATLSFEVLGIGATSIDVLSDVAGNPNQGMTYAQGDNVDLFGRANVTLAVPEPTTWLMGLLGGLLLALRRRTQALTAP